MKYDEKIIEIVKNKKFKTFWHCLDYLLIAGYNLIDAYGISVKEFDGDLFSKVAFAYTREERTGNPFFTTTTELNLVIALIDDTNIHLNGLYTEYRKWLQQGKIGLYPDLENTCEILILRDITPFVLQHINTISEKHFGHELFDLPDTGNRAGQAPAAPTAGLDHDDYRRMLDLIRDTGTDRNIGTIDYINRLQNGYR